jgi:hypothetical protein
MANRLSKHWQNWVNLSRQQKKLFISSLIYLKVASLLLLLFRYQDLHNTLKKRVPIDSSPSPEIAILRATDLSEIVETAARKRLVNATCLRRSLVLWYLLRKEGIESELRFGVRKVSDEIIGHAWVEIDGSVINDDVRYIKQFTPMDVESH